MNQLRTIINNIFKPVKSVQVYDSETLQFGHAYEIKTMYRTYLKLIPTLFDRKLVIQQKLKEVQWIFRQGRDEQCPETIEYYKKMGYQVLKDIENKKFPPFPQMYTYPLRNQGMNLHPFKRNILDTYRF